VSERRPPAAGAAQHRAHGSCPPAPPAGSRPQQRAEVRRLRLQQARLVRHAARFGCRCGRGRERRRASPGVPRVQGVRQARARAGLRRFSCQCCCGTRRRAGRVTCACSRAPQRIQEVATSVNEAVWGLINSFKSEQSGHLRTHIWAHILGRPHPLELYGTMMYVLARPPAHFMYPLGISWVSMRWSMRLGRDMGLATFTSEELLSKDNMC
jgi:hypothetical protein